MSSDRRFRFAERADAAAVAALHADSWRRNYRGAYAESFLDGDVAADRFAVWSKRLEGGVVSACTILAEHDGDLVGFAHAVFDEDPSWGSLLDNIHVVDGQQRHGVGSDLLSRIAEAVAGRRPDNRLYLWVLEQNARAQAFYEARGARRAESALVTSPGGVPGRLNGSPRKLRYAWDDLSALIHRGDLGA